MDFVFSQEQFDFANLDPRIAHMNNEDIVDMVNLYYAGSSISELIKYYNLKVLSSQFVKLFPSIRSEDVCPYCKVNHVIKLTSKSTMYNKFQKSSCPNCGHERSSACTCFNCKTITNEIKQKRDLEKRALIARYYDLSNNDLISELELTNLDKIYLSTLLRASLDEGLKIINPVSEYRDYLTPSQTHDIELIKHLFSKRIILPHPSSKTEAFVDDENFPASFFPLSIAYRVNIDPIDNNYTRMISDLMYPNSLNIRNDIRTCMDIWRRIVLVPTDFVLQ